MRYGNDDKKPRRREGEPCEIAESKLERTETETDGRESIPLGQLCRTFAFHMFY